MCKISFIPMYSDSFMYAPVDILDKSIWGVIINTAVSVMFFCRNIESI